ncbi:MAG: GNAT family N-acetyltransferase [Acidobacteriota bacterium]
MSTPTHETEPRRTQDDPIELRSHVAGDIGWILQRHGELYEAGYQLGPRFEALVAKILSDFALDHDPEHERLWIAHRSGQRLGSVMLVREDAETARLRLFLVEPEARGLGLGTRLMSTLLDFTRRVGYRRIVLTTIDELDAARRIYERVGFRVHDTTRHHDWSVPVVEEEWSLDLTDPAAP